MNPKVFLTIGGTILVTIGFLGIIHVLSTLSSASLFNPPSWINWFHLIFGSLILIVAFSHSAKWQTVMTLFAVIVGTIGGLAGLIFGPSLAIHFNQPELADPSDHIAHLTVGILAFWGWWNRPKK